MDEEAPQSILVVKIKAWFPIQFVGAPQTTYLKQSLKLWKPRYEPKGMYLIIFSLKSNCFKSNQIIYSLKYKLVYRNSVVLITLNKTNIKYNKDIFFYV